MKDCTSTVINFGMQPRCFDYQKNKIDVVELFNFTLSQSHTSGLLQLQNPIPVASLKPKFSWVINKEPDDHAELIATEVLKHTESNDGKVLFLSIYDKKVYDIVRNIIGDRAVLLDPQKDLEILQISPTQSPIQEKINKKFTKKLSRNLGKFEVIVSCRLLEHSHDINSFIDGLAHMLKKDGKIIIEVPDSTKPLLQGDVAMLWEEHIYYFTGESLRLEFESHGYGLEKYIIYNYPQEDALVGVFSKSKRIILDKTPSPPPSGEYAIAKIFKEKVEYLKTELFNQLSLLKKEFGEIIIFGAGHRAIMFINLLEINNLISFVIDDDPNKNNLNIPLAGIEIKNSEEIIWSKIGICIFAISLNVENKVKNNLANKVKKSIKYYSISPDSKISLPIFNKI